MALQKGTRHCGTEKGAIKMAEEKEGLPKGTETPAEPTSPEPGTPEAKEKQSEVDWEKRYKDLQSDHTRTRQRLSELEAEKPPEESLDEFVDDEYLTKKEVDKRIDQAVSKAVKSVQMQSADSYFRRTYPQLVKYESAISGIIHSPKDPESLKGSSAEGRIDAAVKEFNEIVAEEKASAKEQAEKEAKDREEQNRKASGLGGGQAPASKSEEEGESDADYIAKRKARSAKQRGLA